MKKKLEQLKRFLTEGWSKDYTVEVPKYFWQYYIRYELNWIWTLGSILFIVLFLHSEKQYNAPVFYLFALIPFFMLIFNVITEYNAFKRNPKNNKLFMYIFYGACFLIVIIVTIVLFLNRTN